MSKEQKNVAADQQVTIERADFQSLFEALVAKKYKVIGPLLRDGAIAYDELHSVDDLPAGWTDSHDAGKYRLARRLDQALFGYAVGPHSWKKFLFPPVIRLWQAKRAKAGFQILEENSNHVAKMAFLGVRACELSAIAIQDKVFLGGEFVDPRYQARREGVFIVAINCAQAGGTCFCASMNTGPQISSGFDIALTEIVEKSRHYFVAQAGSDRGREVLSAVPATPATEAEKSAASKQAEQAAAQMGRSLDATDLKGLLGRNYEHPLWDAIAARCLTCANCTMVCPTCFCSNVEDVTDLTGDNAERWRKWDSCFTIDYSYIHGGSVRTSAKARYRQWMTHKLANWIDQFGMTGCVGCGRCITWCPAGIDITAEVRAFRQAESAKLQEREKP